MKNEVMKFGTVAYLFFGVTFFSMAQEEFVFRNNHLEDKQVNQEVQLKKHFLGEEIALKLRLLQESYTYMEESDIANTSRTVVEKPSIFYSVKKMEKFYKKELKAGRLTLDEAKSQFDRVLSIAINIRYQETKALEEALWKIKDPSELATLYQKKIQFDY